MSYSANSLGKKGRSTGTIGHADGYLGGPPVAPGFSLDWQGFFVSSYTAVTFDSGSATMSISGLSDGQMYSLFLYTGQPGGGYILNSQTSLGTSTNGVIVAQSPLENGFIAPDNLLVVFNLEHPSN